MNSIYQKHKCSKAKIIKMVGIISSSYYRKPNFGKKGNHPTAVTFHQKFGFVSQSDVVKSIKKIPNNLAHTVFLKITAN